MLSKLATALLTLPNSNADSERAFTVVRKIHTEFRSEMKHDTLCALLSCKFNQTCSCFDFIPGKSLLKAAKGATLEYNRSCQKSD